MIDFGVFRDVMASEWTKVRSVRSTYWTLLAAIILGVGFSAAISAGNAHDYKHADLADKVLFDPTRLSTAGLLFFAQLALGVLAILVMSSEYSTGTIRATMAAVPKRGYTLAAKAILVGVLSGALAMGLAFSGFFICQPIIAHYHAPTASIHGPGVFRAVIGGGLYIAALTLFALGLATIIRHTAGAITALVGTVFILPIVTQLLPDSWQHDFSRYLPANAGSAISSTIPDPNSLTPWVGYFVFVGWAALALGVGWYLLRTRDV
jgi:ABC-type transport system involved in multi-copper enzyme maturation permease subunit